VVRVWSCILVCRVYCFWCVGDEVFGFLFYFGRNEERDGIYRRTTRLGSMVAVVF
jgi:hypothetical protein